MEKGGSRESSILFSSVSYHLLFPSIVSKPFATSVAAGAVCKIKVSFSDSICRANVFIGLSADFVQVR